MKALGILAALFLVFRRFPLRLRLALRLKATRLGYVLWLEGGVSVGLLRWQGLRVQRLVGGGTPFSGNQWFRWVRRAPRLISPVKALEWETVLGLGEAASTAVACGMLWGMAGTLAARMAEAPFRLKVTPDYAQKHLQITLQCIISLSIAQIIGRTIAEIRKSRR